MTNHCFKICWRHYFFEIQYKVNVVDAHFLYIKIWYCIQCDLKNMYIY